MKVNTRTKTFSLDTIGSSIVFAGTLCLFLSSPSDYSALWVGCVFIVAGLIVVGIGDRKEQSREKSLFFANIGATFFGLGSGGLILALITGRQPLWVGITVTTIGAVLIIAAIVQAKKHKQKIN